MRAKYRQVSLARRAKTHHRKEVTTHAGAFRISEQKHGRLWDEIFLKA